MSVFIHELAIVEADAGLGEGSKVWHWAHIRKSARIGENCIIGKGVFVDEGVSLGNNVKVQNNVSIYSGVTIGDGVFVGPHVCFTNDRMPRAVFPDGKLRGADGWTKSHTRVEQGVSIGANSTVVTGITLGRWCMIGAGSTVTRDVPPYALVYGNPATIKGIISAGGEKLSGEYKAGSYVSDSGEAVEILPEWVPRQ